MAAESVPPAPARVPRRLLIGVFAAMCGALALGYALFLRTDYALLYADLKPADAAAIVAQLDAKGIPHRLSDGGTTILVPAADADSVRLAVAGSDIPMKGSVGFELFNKSDMGLTDFAQKINYQRALQGELTRTIMLMDGIDTARVHLAIPERSLFRGNRSAPKAAVEVVTKPGRALTPDRVAGLRQLVASAVPDLQVGEVAILDGEGRIVSQPTVATASYATPEIEEQAAAQAYYAARAKMAVRNVLPGLQVDVRALATGAGESSSETGARGFPLRLTIATATPINPEDQAIARTAIADAVTLDEARGDAIVFVVGALDPVAPIAPTTTTQPTTTQPTTVPPAQIVDSPAPATPLPSTWWLAAVAIVAIVGIGVARARRGSPGAIDHGAFIARLRARTGAEDAARG